MANRALLAGYPRYGVRSLLLISSTRSNLLILEFTLLPASAKKNVLMCLFSFTTDGDKSGGCVINTVHYAIQLIMQTYLPPNTCKLATLSITQLQSPHSQYYTGSTHYSDVIMNTIESLITSLTIVYSTVYSDADQRKHQRSASLAFVRGIHRRPVNSPHKWPVTRKIISFDDVIIKNGINIPYCRLSIYRSQT